MTLSKLATLNGGAANDAEIGAANADLDSLALANDDKRVIDARIARLASLNPIERAREIRATAKEFRCADCRPSNEPSSKPSLPTPKDKGDRLEFPEIEPWASRVDGAQLLTEIATPSANIWSFQMGALKRWLFGLCIPTPSNTSATRRVSPLRHPKRDAGRRQPLMCLPSW